MAHFFLKKSFATRPRSLDSPSTDPSIGVDKWLVNENIFVANFDKNLERSSLQIRLLIQCDQFGRFFLGDLKALCY